jgi:hypothetical protein
MTPPSVRDNGINPERPPLLNPRRLRAVELQGAEPALRAPERLLDNLPLELSSFVGWERELAEVKRLLENNRLLTPTKSTLPQVYDGEIVGVFAKFSDAFYGVNRRWHYNYANRCAQELWGRSKEEVLGKNT